jgi:hypothetical protein
MVNLPKKLLLLYYILWFVTFVLYLFLFLTYVIYLYKYTQVNHLSYTFITFILLVEKVQIESHPAKCEKRCRRCVYCEAVQIPIVSSKVQIQRSRHSGAKVIYSSRGDDLSNYKFISWKCKCRDYLFNS